MAHEHLGRAVIATAMRSPSNRLGSFVSLVAIARLACACSGGNSNGASSDTSGDTVTLAVTGTQGVPIAANTSLDVFLVPLSIDGVSGNAVVDTGSPIVALDPSAFSGATLPDGAGTVASMTLGSLLIADPSLVGADLVTSPDPTVPMDGSLGCGVLCAFIVSLDYRGQTVTFGASSPPSGVEEPGASVAFTLQGGGTATLTDVPGTVQFPPSRILLTTTVEGQTYSFVVDSGSSFVLLREALFTSLVADGRAQIAGVGTAIIGQESSSAVTRVRSFSVGGQEVAGLVASSDSALEATLDDVASEIGQDVDGLIGGSFLRDFYVTVDYPGGALGLRRYTTGAPTYDSFDRVGVTVVPPTTGSSGPMTVAYVFSGTDAAAHGVMVGDVIVAIDGQPLAGLGSTAIDVLLSGPVGSTKSVQFGTTGAPTLSMRSVSIAVDDVLPL